MKKRKIFTVVFSASMCYTITIVSVPIFSTTWLITHYHIITQPWCQGFFIYLSTLEAGFSFTR